MMPRSLHTSRKKGFGPIFSCNFCDPSKYATPLLSCPDSDRTEHCSRFVLRKHSTLNNYTYVHKYLKLMKQDPQAEASA
jgi:hypothetical protein